MKKIYTIYGHHLKTAKPKEKWYVGYTEQKLEYRWNNGKGYNKTNTKFYNAIKKYGWDAFEHIIIAETDTIESALICEEMFKRMYDSVENGYNCFYGENVSPSKDPDVAKKISKAHQGKKRGPHSEDHKRKISESQKGKSRKPHTNESMDIISVII